MKIDNSNPRSAEIYAEIFGYLLKNDLISNKFIQQFPLSQEQLTAIIKNYDKAFSQSSESPEKLKVLGLLLARADDYRLLSSHINDRLLSNIKRAMVDKPDDLVVLEQRLQQQPNLRI